MRILLSSWSFHPSIGGLEAVSQMLAEEFFRRGHEVTVVTETPAGGEEEFPFRVWRRPAPSRLIQLLRHSDVYLQNHISLLLAWPLLFVRRPWVVAHHNWTSRSGLRGRMKHSLLTYGRSIACSRAIAHSLGVPSTIAGGPYDDRTFRVEPDAQRNRDLIYVGRLAAGKGPHLLLDAVNRLKLQGIEATVTITGFGPDSELLMKQAKNLGIARQVEFTGPRSGRDLALLLNRHRIQVVPSVWQEPFGIVALEGIACGCVIVGSEQGGLKDAIGRCGVTFPNGDVSALTDSLSRLLRDPSIWGPYREAAASHLQSYTRSNVADSYLKVLMAVNATPTA
ncbi:MAG: glycosyltransferase family 4 protein [Bryobacteraceae bacterium]|jgi:glycosyltransferase involved in cell wall biosynthesis